MGGAFCQRKSCAALTAASMTRFDFIPEKRTRNPSVPIACGRSIFDPVDLDIDALANLAAVTGARREQVARLLGRLRLDTPLFGARDVHSGVVGLERGFEFEGGNSHGLLRANHPVERSLARCAGENKSATQARSAINASIPAPEQDSVASR